MDHQENPFFFQNQKQKAEFTIAMCTVVILVTEAFFDSSSQHKHIGGCLLLQAHSGTASSVEAACVCDEGQVLGGVSQLRVGRVDSAELTRGSD